jgi:hypothetical protein
LKDVHPQLRADAWLDRWIGAALMGLAAMGLFAAVAIGAVRGSTPMPILLLGGVIGLSFAWAAWWGWGSARRYRRTTWVLEHMPPVEAIAEFLRGEPDSMRLTLEGDGHPARLQWYVPCALPKWAASLGDRVKVRAHIDPLPGGPIVVETDAGIIWPLSGSPTSAVAEHGPARTGNPLHLLEQRLTEQDCARQAERLSAVSTGAYTSSSELLGDYGLAMKTVRAECWRRMDAQTREAYAAAAKAVRAAWPAMRL